MCPKCRNEVYKTTNQNNTVTRNSSLKLFQPLMTKALSQKCLSYIIVLWNRILQAFCVFKIAQIVYFKQVLFYILKAVYFNKVKLYFTLYIF